MPPNQLLIAQHALIVHASSLPTGFNQRPGAHRFDDWLAPLAWMLERLLQRPSTHRADHAELDD